MPGLLSIEDALAQVLARVRPLAAEPVPLALATGRYAAEDAASRVDLPPFASSAMDGFAVRAADAPGMLPVAAHVAAGRPVERALAPGEAFGIATGGAVPEGADAVVPLEYVVRHGNEIEIAEPVDEGANVRPRGGDLRAGDVVVERGARLDAGRVGALAAAGIADVACGGRPLATVLATGTELRRPGEELGPGQIYEANSVMLAAALQDAGAATRTLTAVTDDEHEHRDALERGLAGGNVLVTSGGVSVGPHDLVRGIGASLGVEEVFWRVAVKPGKPVWFGVRGDTLVFGLPGNPVSALVCFELLVRPAVLALQGARDPGPRYLAGELASPVRRGADRDELLRARARLDGDTVVLEPVRGQESHMIARAAGADALVHVPRGDGELAAGARVRYLSLGV